MDAYLQAGLDALGDGTRMAIFQRLANGPMAVNELATMLPVSRPAVSQHLRVLKDAGLVTDQQGRDAADCISWILRVLPGCGRTSIRCGSGRWVRFSMLRRRRLHRLQEKRVYAEEKLEEKGERA